MIMAKASVPTFEVQIIETITLDELCRLCVVEKQWVTELVVEGILDPAGAEPAAWRFSAVSISRTNIARRLARDLDVNMAGIAVALELISERDALHERLALFAATSTTLHGKQS